MTETVIVGILSLVGTLGGALIAGIYTSKLTAYRIEQLEKKMDKYNNLVDRTYKVESRLDVVDEELKNIREDVTDAKNYKTITQR